VPSKVLKSMHDSFVDVLYLPKTIDTVQQATLFGVSLEDSHTRTFSRNLHRFDELLASVDLSLR
jgi:hypothetical protein